jgi:hypothetical protein
MAEVTCAIVGLNFHGTNARECLARAQVGYVCRLVRENHPSDRNAVQVHVLGMWVGYVPRTHNPDMAKALDRGATVTAIITRALVVEGRRVKSDALITVSW